MKFLNGVPVGAQRADLGRASAVLFITVSLVSILVALALSATEPAFRKFFDNAHWTVACCGAAAIAWIRARSSSSHERPTIRWFAIALTVYALGQVVWDIQVAAKENPFRGPSDVLFGLLAPLLAVGLIRDLVTRVPAAYRISAVLDVTCITVACSAVTITTYLGNRVEPPDELALLIFYPTLLAMSAATCLVVALSVPMRLGLGFVCVFAALIWHAAISLRWNLLALDGQLRNGTLFNASFSAAILLLSLGVLLWDRRTSESGSWARFCSSFIRMLPLTMVATVCAALVLAWNTSGIGPAIRVFDTLAAAVVVVTASVRQILQLDETERRLRAEQALSASEERFRVTLDLFPVPAGITGMVSSHLAYVNAAFAELFGRSAEELTGSSAIELGLWAYPEERGRVLEILKQDGRCVAAEVSMRSRDGNILPILLSCAIVQFAEEDYVAFSMTDISRRKAIEEAIRVSEERRRMMFEEAVDGIFVADLDARYVDVNSTGAKMFGYSREEVLGLHIYDLVAPIHVDRIDAEIELLQTGATSESEWLMVRRDGSTFWVDVKAKLLPDGLIQAIVRDLTELKEAEAATQALEAHLRHSQKMEAIGTLAAGIAHDFNNVLAAIRGNADLAIEDLSAGLTPTESLEEIRKAGRRATDLVQRILAFSRKQDEPQELLSLSGTVDEIVKMLRATLPADVEIHTSIEEGVPAIVGDETQLQQILVNLCTNSWQAMGGKPGRIDVRIRSATVEGSSAMNLAEGEYACVEVEDSGCGIPLNVLDRIFEPFYTTKDVGQGTGLGLAVVHSIVKGHKGAIVVESTVGRGSTFRVYLPSAQSNVVLPPTTVPVSREVRPRQGVSVVYVDDDEALVYLVRRVLTRRSVNVTTFESAPDALAALRSLSLRPDVLVTDLNMPEMSGFELAQGVLQAQPDLPIILTSGYVSEEMEERAAILGIQRVLYKPTAPDEMCTEIMSLLSQLAPVPSAAGE